VGTFQSIVVSFVQVEWYDTDHEADDVNSLTSFLCCVLQSESHDSV